MGAVINPGQHDDGRGGRLAKGDGQQQRNCRHRTNARQHANRGADDATDQTEKQVIERERNAEAMREIGNEIHGILPSRSDLRPERHADIKVVDENRPAERAKEGAKPDNPKRAVQMFLIRQRGADHRDNDGNNNAQRFKRKAE